MVVLFFTRLNTNIKSVLGSTDDFYLKISSAVANNALGMLVTAVNEKVEELSKYPLARFVQPTSLIKDIIKGALDTMYKLGTLDMSLPLKTYYKQNLEGIKSLAEQLAISTLSPRQKLQDELRQAEYKLKEIQNTIFFQSELTYENNEMNKIKEWHFLRTQEDREKQINDQQRKINYLIERANFEKKSQIIKQQTLINDIKSKIQKAEY